MASSRQTIDQWGVATEYGPLRDVLLCRPDNFEWLPTSSISKEAFGPNRAPTRSRTRHIEFP